MVVSNDDVNIYVTFCVDAPWLLDETQVEVAETAADLPQTPGGLVPGRFEYNDPHGYVMYYTYTIPLNGWEAGDELVIAAHADIVQLEDSEVIESEGAWGQGTTVGRNWSMYFEYTVQAVNLLTNGDFEACSDGTKFMPNTPIGAAGPWNQWLAFTSWECDVETSGNLYAAQDPSLHVPPLPNITQQIKQAIDGDEVPSGTWLQLSFRYRANVVQPPQIQVYGLASGQTWLPFPIGGWPLGQCTGCTLLLQDSFPVSTTWATYTSAPFQVSANFETVAVGIRLGGPSPAGYFRGIDDVVLEVVPAP